MRRTAVVAFAAALACIAMVAPGASAAVAEIAGIPVEINAYKDGTIRLRARATAGAYEVTDVVVAEDVPAITLQRTSTGYEMGNGPATLKVGAMADPGEKRGLAFEYTINGAVVSAGHLFLETAQSTEPRVAFDFPQAKKL